MEPEMTSTLDYGKELAVNETLSSENRKEVSEDAKYLDERWRALMKTTDEEYARQVVYSKQYSARKESSHWSQKIRTLHCLSLFPLLIFTVTVANQLAFRIRRAAI